MYVIPLWLCLCVSGLSITMLLVGIVSVCYFSVDMLFYFLLIFYLFFPLVYVCDLMVFDGVESFTMSTIVVIDIVLFALVFVDFPFSCLCLRLNVLPFEC